VINLLKLKSVYGRNALTLMAGTLIAQVIQIAITPILTRIYLPAEFDAFASYSACVAILGVVAMGRLDMAIMLPRRDDYADAITTTAILISVIVSFLILLVVFAIDILQPILGFINFELWFYLIPIGVFLYSTYMVFITWYNRQKNYKLMSRNRIVQASSISGMQVFFGVIIKSGTGLIFADILGRALSIFIIAKQNSFYKRIFVFKKHRKIALLKKYKNFPRFEMAASLFNVSSFQTPIIVIPFLFTSEGLVAQYFIVYRVLMAPVSVIGTAVLEVFKNKAQDEFRDAGNIRPLFIKTGVALFLIGIFPTIILVIYAPDLFAFILGEPWRESGVFAQLLAPMVLFRFVSAPLSYVLIVREKLRLDMLLQTLFFSTVCGSFVATYFINDIKFLILMLSISGCAFYITQICFSFKWCAK